MCPSFFGQEASVLKFWLGWVLLTLHTTEGILPARAANYQMCHFDSFPTLHFRVFRPRVSDGKEVPSQLPASQKEASKP